MFEYNKRNIRKVINRWNEYTPVLKVGDMLITRCDIEIAIKKSLLDEQKQITQLWMDGYKDWEIADMVNVSEKSIEMKKLRIIKRLDDYLNYGVIKNRNGQVIYRFRKKKLDENRK